MNTTSINELPTDPSNGGSINGNVNLVANEIQTPETNTALSLDQTTINQIVNGLQQASVAGATTLPSRDIPQNTNVITQDSYIQPNYIPQPTNNIQTNDYIKDEPILITYNDDKTIDTLYDEIQTPLLLGILYFVFQLPIFKRIIYKNLGFLCNNDGNYNLNGLIFVSSLYGIIYYFLTKLMTYFSKF
jgi:hypothetical protein